MAIVSGTTSTLNPNAPLFVPAAFRLVEDFSSEWWQLVKTSSWFHDYWLSQHQEEASFINKSIEDDNKEVANSLVDSFDLDFDEEFSPEDEMQEWNEFMEDQNESTPSNASEAL